MLHFPIALKSCFVNDWIRIQQSFSSGDPILRHIPFVISVAAAPQSSISGCAVPFSFNVTVHGLFTIAFVSEVKMLTDETVLSSKVLTVLLIEEKFLPCLTLLNLPQTCFKCPSLPHLKQTAFLLDKMEITIIFFVVTNSIYSPHNGYGRAYRLSTDFTVLSLIC